MRKISMAVSQVVAGGLQMKRNRVVNPAFDLLAQQLGPNRVATIAADDEQVVTRLASLGFSEQGHAVVRQSFSVNRRKPPTPRIPFLKALELGTQPRRLDSIEPRVVAVCAVGVMGQPAVIAQRAN